MPLRSVPLAAFAVPSCPDGARGQKDGHPGGGRAKDGLR